VNTPGTSLLPGCERERGAIRTRHRCDCHPHYVDQQSRRLDLPNQAVKD